MSDDGFNGEKGIFVLECVVGVIVLVDDDVKRVLKN